MERISTGNEPLDQILDGGVPANSINLITGAPGSGKTILAQQLAFASGDGGRPALYLSTLSEPLPKMLGYLQEQGFADISQIGTEVVYESLGHELDKAPETLSQQILQLIQQHRPRILVIDSFKALADLMPDTQSWRRVVFELAGLLTAYDTTSFWVGEYHAPSGGGQVEFAIADGILELRRDTAGARDDRYLRVLKLRGSGFQDGYHAFTITGNGLHVFPRLVGPSETSSYRPAEGRLQSGIGGLDDMIESGWLRGTSTLVAGPSGAGKTMVGLHFLRQGVESGEPGLLVNFQENPVQLCRAMSRLGWSPDDLVGAGKLDLFYVSPVELQIDTIVEGIFRRIESHGVRRVVVDGLADLERSAREPGRFRDYIYALTQHFAQRNLTSMLTLEAVGNVSGLLWTQHEVSYMTDNILLLAMELDNDLTRTVRVVKSRGSAHDGRRRTLRIGRGGIELE